LYFPGGLSSVPREWGVELLIPKSPLFYFAFSPLGALPFDLETSVKWLICLLDASLVLVAFWLARRVGLSAATAGLAALLYAFIPLAYRAFAYGILPTIFAQWLAALLLVLVLWLSGRKWGWLTWIGAVLLATLVLLSFPTIALFVALVVAAYSVLLALRKQPAEPRGPASSVRWILVLAIAGAISLVAYYGLYAEAVVASAVALVAPRAGQETARWPGGWAELVAWTSDYVVTLLPILLAAFGLLLLLVTRRRSVPATQALLLLTLWIAIAPVFFVANYRVDMIGKHLFFTMLPVTVLGAALLGRVVRRNTPGALFVGLVLTSVAWQGLVFWLDRLVRASS
jgi:hypothetical protein